MTISSNLNYSDSQFPVNKSNSSLSISSETEPPENQLERLVEDTSLVSEEETSSLNGLLEASDEMMATEDFENEATETLTRLILLTLENPAAHQEKRKNKTATSMITSPTDAAYQIERSIDVAVTAGLLDDAVRAFMDHFDKTVDEDLIQTLSGLLSKAATLTTTEVILSSHLRTSLLAFQLPEKNKRVKECEMKIKKLSEELSSLEKTDPSHSRIQMIKSSIEGLKIERAYLVKSCYKDLLRFSLKGASIDAKVLSAFVKKGSTEITPIVCCSILATTLAATFASYRIVHVTDSLMDAHRICRKIKEEIKLNNAVIKDSSTHEALKKVLDLRNKSLKKQYADTSAAVGFKTLILGSYSTGLGSGAFSAGAGALTFIGKAVAGAAAFGTAAAIAGTLSTVLFAGGLAIGAAYLGYRKNKEIRASLNTGVVQARAYFSKRKVQQESIKIQKVKSMRHLNTIELAKLNREHKLFNLNLNMGNIAAQTIHLANANKVITELNNMEDPKIQLSTLRHLSRLCGKKEHFTDFNELNKLPIKVLKKAQNNLSKIKMTKENKSQIDLISKALFYSIQIKKEKREVINIKNRVHETSQKILQLNDRVKHLTGEIRFREKRIENIFKTKNANLQAALEQTRKKQILIKLAGNFGISVKELESVVSDINNMQGLEKTNLKKLFHDTNIDTSFLATIPALSVLDYCNRKVT